MKKILLFSALVILTGPQICAQCNTNISGTLNSCATSCNGSVTFSSSTGTPPYNLVVTGGPSVQYTSSYTWANVCPGSYHYDITDASTSCHDTGTVTVTAIPVTVAPALTIEAFDILGNSLGSNPTICQFQHIDLFVQPPFTNVLPNTFSWNVNGIPAMVQNNLVNFLNATFSSSTLSNGDSVFLEVSWPNACISPNPSISHPIHFTVVPNQPPALVITDNSMNDTICFGNTITFTATPIDAGTPAYQWYLNAIAVGSASTYTTSPALLAGNYQVICCITSSEYCDTQDPVYNPVVCDTTDFYVEICTPIQELNSAGSITIFPNPATNQFTICDVRFTISKIEIYNILGENVFSEQVTNNPKQVTVNTSTLPPGIYFVKVKGEKEESVAKFVKQ